MSLLTWDFGAHFGNRSAYKNILYTVVARDIFSQQFNNMFVDMLTKNIWESGKGVEGRRANGARKFETPSP